jgi:peptidoglycan-associated lipoprotein
MMLRARRAWLAGGLAIVIAAAACGPKRTTVKADPPLAPAAADPTPAPPPPPPRPPSPPPPAKALTEEEAFARKSLDELNNERPLDDVFFDYDSADLSEAARAALAKNSGWLKRWTSTKVTVEGHADTRGTNEYNLALGERRASAVRDYLGNLGVAGDRVAIVSKGEEQQTCAEENEACWSRNRRGHFIITGK